MAKDRKTRSPYVRLDDAKQNYSAIGEARWFEKVVYTLDNGEAVAAAVPWTAPDPWDGISVSVANRILDDIDAGVDGRRYSAAPNAAPRPRRMESRRGARPVADGEAGAGGHQDLDQGRNPDQQRVRGPCCSALPKGLFVNPANRPGARG